MPKRIIKGSVKAVRWWWELPRWVKFGKLALILMAVLSLPAIDLYQQWKYYHQIYDQYYTYFYDSYKQSYSTAEAQIWADHYADFYASYYSSSSFRDSLKNGLPSATAENVSYPASSVNAHLTITHQGLALLKQFEGVRHEPYYDVGGKLTIGYGHLIKPGEYFTKLSEKQAGKLLQEDVKVAEAYIKRLVTIQLNYAEFSALTSLVYNIGPGHFQRSTLLYALNNGKRSQAAREFLRWNKVGSQQVKGLSRRREAEKALFES